jgi:hypothetical protein
MQCGARPGGMGVQFVLEREVRAPAEFVHHWWVENGPSFEPTVGEGVQQERVRDGAYRLTVRRQLRTPGGLVGVESIHQVAGVSEWTCQKTTSVDGGTVSIETIHYRLHPTDAGCRLRALFEIRSPTPARNLTLRWSKVRLAKHREGEIDRAIAELEGEFRGPGR